VFTATDGSSFSNVQYIRSMEQWAQCNAE